MSACIRSFRRRALLSGLAITTAISFPSSALADRGFAPPFDRPAPARLASAPTCEPTPPVQQELNIVGRYVKGDPSASRIDPAKDAQGKAAMRPSADFLGKVSLFANRYVRSQGRDQLSGACAQRWLADWAAADAWSRPEDAGWLKLSTSIAGTALDYLQVKELEVGDGRDRAAIESWLERSAERIRRHSDSILLGDPRHNNHRYWAGLAVAASGLATGTQTDLEWGMGALREGACAVAANGTLPLELKRGAAALHYHNYALQPLVLLAEIAERNGRPGYSLCNGGVRRLAALVLQAAEDPSRLEQLAGVPQKPIIQSEGRLRGSQWTWLAPYGQRFDLPPSWRGRALETRRLASAETGGDLMLLYPWRSTQAK